MLTQNGHSHYVMNEKKFYFLFLDQELGFVLLYNMKG